jgi:hypothetical protein
MSVVQLKDIYQQNLNFLVGAGASSGLFPTLWLDLKNSDIPDNQETIETLATKLADQRFDSQRTLLFMHYFSSIIAPVKSFSASSLPFHDACFFGDCDICISQNVIKNYEIFIESIILLLNQKDNFKRQCNLFTTNYDSCIPQVADRILKSGTLDFSINDGTRGFFERTLSARNFNTYICQTGVLGTNITDIPQLNLINVHGSAHWEKELESINVDYSQKPFSNLIPDSVREKLQVFQTLLLDSNKSTEDIINFDKELSDQEIIDFWEEYNKLPIVNPTKWKFHETVFEEHYYQMLRFLSYELEKPNSVLITFAFSFADEHILNLVKRSLTNPRLKVFVCCFNEKEKQVMHNRFKLFKNVQLVAFEDGVLDFTRFNKDVFNADILRDTE